MESISFLNLGRSQRLIRRLADKSRSSADGDALNRILFSGPDKSGPTGKGRSDLRLRYSTDETATWRDGPLIHEGPAAYSDMVRLKADRYGILFEAGQKGKK